MGEHYHSYVCDLCGHWASSHQMMIGDAVCPCGCVSTALPVTPACKLPNARVADCTHPAVAARRPVMTDEGAINIAERRVASPELATKLEALEAQLATGWCPNSQPVGEVIAEARRRFGLDGGKPS